MIVNAHSYLFSQGLPMASHILSQNTWRVISQVSQAGLAADYWSIGDTKVSGRYTCTLIGINQEEGGHSMTFSLGKVSDSASIAFTDFSPTGVISQTEAYWKKCAYAKTGGLISSIRESLPADLREVLRHVPKSFVEAKADGSSPLRSLPADLFPPSQYELFGSGASYDQQYQFYAAGGEKIKGSMWLRDAYGCSWYDGLNGARSIITFRRTSDGSLSYDGYTDRWNYAGVTGRTGTTNAGLQLLFVV